MKDLFKQVSGPGETSNFVVWQLPGDPFYTIGESFDCGLLGVGVVVETQEDWGGPYGKRRALLVRAIRPINL